MQFLDISRHIPIVSSEPSVPTQSDSSAPDESHRGWYSRGYLPHYDSSDVIQFITWRLADSLPRHLQEQLEQELAARPAPFPQMDAERRKKIEAILDRGYGECWLRRKACASIVRDCLFNGHCIHYQLHAWVIMPNHVHVLVQFFSDDGLREIVEAWKASTALQMNDCLRRSGAVWQEDYWDRFIRDAQHYQNTMRYIRLNPVRAGLVTHFAKWPWWWSAF